MSDVYPESIKYYYWDGDSWEDISVYVMHRNGEHGVWGMRTNQYTDRIAAPGQLSILLNSLNGRFDPDSANVLTGWAINTEVKMVITYDGVPWAKFTGYVETVKLDYAHGNYTASVTIKDFMGHLYRKTLAEQSIETFKRGGEIAADIVTATGQTPLATNYAAGDYEFPAAFDSMTTTTKAATELNKVALSEGGYFYNRHDKVNGETLTFEAESTRGNFAIGQLPKLVADCGHILLAGGTDKILLAGSADALINNEVQDAHMNGAGGAYARTHGENIINKVRVTVYPKRIDEAEATLYKLGTRIVIGSGKTKTIKAKYKNNTTKEDCNAIPELMVQPVPTTDYTMHRYGKPTIDLTSNLTVTAVYETAEVTLTLVNSSKYTGTVNKLICRGFGIYQDSPITVEAEDTTSAAAYGDSELTIQQQYQRDTEMGEVMAGRIVDKEKDPRTRLEKVTFIANKSAVNMLAFLAVDIGTIVKITESSLNLANYYYVQGIDFSISEGNVITYTWILSDALPTIANGGLTKLNILSVLAAIDFGTISKLQGLEEISIALTVTDLNFENDTGGGLPVLTIGTYNEATPVTNSCLQVYLKSDGTYSYPGLKTYKFDTTGGNWIGSLDAFTANDQFTRLLITYKPRDVHAVPSIYLGGGLQTQTEVSAPDGGLLDEAALPLVIGGYKSELGVPTGIHRGYVQDVKIWGRILTAAEITADAAGDDITDGLLFWGLNCLTSDTATYYNAALTEAQKLYDSIGGYIGTPYDDPIAVEFDTFYLV